MIEFFITPLKYEFIVHAIIAGGLIGILCGIIGVYIVLRGMSYIGHGLSHAAFGGAVIGYISSVNLYIAAGIWGLLSALLINLITRGKKIKADAAIGIVTTASFALGVALISRIRRFTKNLEAVLFGNILGVTTEDLLIIGTVTLIVIIVFFFLYKQMLFVTFDPESASVYGIRINGIDTIFSILLAASIIASLQVLGVTLIAAAIIIPASTARLLTNNFHKMFFLSIIISIFTSIAGIYASFYLNAASGATIVLLGAAIFTIVLIQNYIHKRILEHEHEHVHSHGDIVHHHKHIDTEEHRHEHKERDSSPRSE